MKRGEAFIVFDRIRAVSSGEERSHHDHSSLATLLLAKQTQRQSVPRALRALLHFKQMKQKITSKAPVNTTIQRVIDPVAELLSNNTQYLWDNGVLAQKFSLLPSNTLMWISLSHTQPIALYTDSVAIFRNTPPCFFFPILVSGLIKPEFGVNIRHYSSNTVRVSALWDKNHKTFLLPAALRWHEGLFGAAVECNQDHLLKSKSNITVFLCSSVLL